MREQISVTLNPALRKEIEELARREERTVAGQVRRWIAEGLAASRTAGRHQQPGMAA